MKYFILIFFSLFISIISVSQEVTKEKTVKYINEKLKDYCIFDIKDTKLIINFFKDGENYRQDKMFGDALDYKTIFYSEDEKSIIMKCLSSEDECIERNIYKQNAKKPYTRLAINVEHLDQKSIDSLIKAFAHMIRLCGEPDYKLFEFFE
jgi:hypothetical protein